MPRLILSSFSRSAASGKASSFCFYSSARKRNPFMNSRFILCSALILFFGASLRAQGGEDVLALHLLPAPKHSEMAVGKFSVVPGTRILIDARHATEDRLAAESLVDEIREQSGMKLPMESATAAPKEGNVIVLARLEDRGLRAALEARGISIDEKLGEQGYALIADPSHIVVAGNT